MKTLPMSDCCIVTTEVNKERLKKLKPNINNILVYSYDSLPIFKKRAVIDKNKINILFVITKSPNKRSEILFKQARMISERNKNKIRFHLVTPDFKHFSDTLKFQNDIDIRVYTELPEEEMMNLYSQVDFFWSASIIEGFGIPVRLAFLCNTYVICPDTKINRESSCNCGYYYNESSNKSLSSITESIINNTIQVKNIEYIESEKANIINNNRQFIKKYKIIKHLS